MGDGTFDDVKGRAKEAAGAVTGDEELEREGKLDRLAGAVKDKAGAAVETARDAVGEVVDRAKRAADRD